MSDVSDFIGTVMAIRVDCHVRTVSRERDGIAEYILCSVPFQFVPNLYPGVGGGVPLVNTNMPLQVRAHILDRADSKSGTVVR